MRIYLIYPPSNCNETYAWLEPLGLGYVGAVCREAGHEVRLKDLLRTDTADVEGLFAELDDFGPEVVGFSAMTENFRNALEIARAVKRRYGCTVIFGGWHVSGEPSVVSDPAIDFVVCGEGEETILELLSHLEGKGPAKDQIQGIAYSDAGRVVTTPSRPRMKSLDHLPRPIREGLPVAHYQAPQLFSEPPSRMRTLSVQASRGCPYKCVFCQTPTVLSSAYVRRLPTDVVDEIEELLNTYNNNTLFFRDEEFTLRPEWVMELCEEMTRRQIPKRMTWGAYCRVDDLSAELVAAMKRAGCAFAHLGVEAASEADHQRLKKFYRNEHAENAFRLLRRAGITAEGSWIIGFPWDTEDSLEAAFKWIHTLELDFLVVLFATPFGGTPLREEVEREGLLLTKDSNYFNVNEPVIRTPHIERQRLLELQLEYRRRFYLRPAHMAHVARRILREPRLVRIVAELALDKIGRARRLRQRSPEERRDQSFFVPRIYLEPLGERSPASSNLSLEGSPA